MAAGGYRKALLRRQIDALLGVGEGEDGSPSPANANGPHQGLSRVIIPPGNHFPMFRSPEMIRQMVKDGFGRGRVLVVGDLMLDAYLWGEVSRVSPDLPVPVSGSRAGARLLARATSRNLAAPASRSSLRVWWGTMTRGDGSDACWREPASTVASSWLPTAARR